MTYRDDTALVEACDVMDEEVAQLQTRLTALAQRGKELDRDVRRARKRLVLHRCKKWLRAHPRSMVAMLLVLVVAGYGAIRYTLTARAQRDRRVATLGKGCDTRLLVRAQIPGAAAFINDARIGTVPVDVRICPGSYILRLYHDRTLPWQVRLRVHKQEVIEFNTQLVPRRERDFVSPGTLVLSQPPGALLFVDGREVGWTPHFIMSQRNPGTRVQLGLWRPGYRPSVWHLERKPSLWLHLGAPPPEAAP